MHSADTRGVESIESAVRTLALLPGRRPAFGRLSQPLSEAPSHQADGPRFDREPTHSAAASAIRRRQILSTRFDPWPRRSRRALAARDGFVDRRHEPGEAAQRALDWPGVKSNDASAFGVRNHRRRDSGWQCTAKERPAPCWALNALSAGTRIASSARRGARRSCSSDSPSARRATRS